MADRDELVDLNAEAERAIAADDVEGAEKALRRALRLQEAQLGLVHPDIARTLNALGAVCHDLGRPDEAEFLYRRAVGIARKEFTDEHPYIATGLRNLSELYRAQGKPEKLATLSERVAPRSGLPQTSSDHVTVRADATVGGETEGLPSATSPPPPVLDRPLVPAGTPWRWRPVALWAGTLVVLFAVVWVAMIGGNRSPDVDVATPASAAVSSEPATDPLSTAFDRVEGPGDAPIPEVSDEASDERRRDVAESTRPTAAASVDAGAVDDSALARGLTAPVARDDASEWTVAEAKLCSQLDVRSADGSMRGEWRCAPIVDQTVPGPLFFYTRIRSRTDTVIEHRWLRNGLPVQQVNLEIKTNDGPGYRTYSLRTVSGDERGAWRVEVRSANGDLLYAEEFVVS